MTRHIVHTGGTPVRTLRKGAWLFVDQTPLRLEMGGEISPLEVEFETWGTLSAAGDNAILICPSFSAHSHARSHEDNHAPGWWEDMIGPGLAFDTRKYFLICSSLLGGSHGTTGPLAPNPATGKPYAGDFPVVSIRDIVEVQARLLDHIGVRQLHAAVGGSMGAMETLELAVRHPQRCRRVLFLSGTDKTRAYTATIRHVGRRAIMLDPAFEGGHYTVGPRQGLKLAREIGTIFYRSRQDFNTRFSCDPLDAPNLSGITFDFQSYLNHMGNKILDVFDANSYLRLSFSMDLHDVARGFSSLAEALAGVEAEFLVMGVEQDPLIPIDEQRAVHDALLDAGKASQWHSLSSRFGHDAFLKEFDWMTPKFQEFLDRP